MDTDHLKWEGERTWPAASSNKACPFMSWRVSNLNIVSAFNVNAVFLGQNEITCILPENVYSFNPTSYISKCTNIQDSTESMYHKGLILVPVFQIKLVKSAALLYVLESTGNCTLFNFSMPLSHLKVPVFMHPALALCRYLTVDSILHCKSTVHLWACDRRIYSSWAM